MIYWHIQMNQPWGRNVDKIDSSQMLKLEEPIIGTGEWNDIQCRYFKGGENGLQVGDIILVREGSVPLALCKVIGPNFTDKKLTEQFVNVNFRRVKVLDWYRGGQSFPQPQGTLERLYNNQTRSWKFIDSWYKNISEVLIMTPSLNLLKKRKQVILHGPPGTGKTYLAKKLAAELCQTEQLVAADKPRMIRYIHPGLGLSTLEGNPFTIQRIVGETVHLTVGNGGAYHVTLDQVIRANNERDAGVQGRSYALGLAKYFTEQLAKDNWSLVQFHPSYSYEDFVRGIVAETQDNQIGYKTVDKLLAQIAARALKNWENSQKTSEEFSRDSWVQKKFDLYIPYVEKQLGENGTLSLTNKVDLVKIDDDCFRYQGESWSAPSRVNFKDFKELILARLVKGQDLELEEVKRISRHAFYRYTYYQSLMQLFFDYAGNYESSGEVVEPLKNYVLIIDEINRANLPAVLGELIYALEYRNEPVESLYELPDGNRSIILPPNLYIMGTMNTADRSLAHVDYAIRRRFAFQAVLPTSVSEMSSKGKEYFELVAGLFVSNFGADAAQWKATENIATDFDPKDVMVGHSYFLGPESDLGQRMRYEVAPLLMEYVKDGILNNTDKVKEVLHTLNAADE